MFSLCNCSPAWNIMLQFLCAITRPGCMYWMDYRLIPFLVANMTEHCHTSPTTHTHYGDGLSFDTIERNFHQIWHQSESVCISISVLWFILVYFWSINICVWEDSIKLLKWYQMSVMASQIMGNSTVPLWGDSTSAWWITLTKVQ